MSQANDRTPANGVENEALLGLLAQLDLEEKVLILTGQDFWSTWPIEKIGLRSMVVSDGPSGVRGPTWDERSPSINLPSATALSSSWDLDAAYRYGTVSANEARRKGVDVVLGPTINLHRSPLGGRHFEAFSEDPLLTAELAASYVHGVQDNGVGATPKHYVANDFETERFTADVTVSDRALRELYLLAFEKSITEARAWMVMSAYNSINGATATENELLETPLNSEWGFDGVVVSDWTAVRSLDSARYSQDLVMPGPKGPWGAKLVEAVRNGEIDEAAVDRKVLRLLLLAARVGALADFDPPATPTPIDGIAFAREAEIEGTVLVRNEGALPVVPGTVSSVAVIGHNAVLARTQGGGSATVIPESVVSPLDGIRAAFPDAAITYSRGAIVQEGVAEFPPGSMTNPITGGPGAHVRMLDADGNELFAEDRFAGALVYFGGDAPVGQMKTFDFATQWTPEETGKARIGCAVVGTARIFVNDELVDEQQAHPVGNDLGAAFLAPPSMTVEVDAVAGQPIDFRLEHRPLEMSALAGAMSITLGVEPPVVDDDQLIAEAAAAAAAADVAIVVVGTNAKVESEGYDRSSLDLPGRQDDLVRAVAAANPRTIVIVNAGSPVAMPWRDEVAAVALTWFGGQQYGNALADVITGAAEPGGRLPTTWPATQDDVPVLDVTPVDDGIEYAEGIHIGYRAWLKAGTAPAYPFGFGLGYTTWLVGPASLADDGDTTTVTVPLTNTGDRAGKHVVQVYASRPSSAVDRPVRWLVGFTTVRADAGASTSATITIPRRAFMHWDGEWKLEAGTFDLSIATSVDDIVETLSLEV
ncbi:MAG: glycoside hydrolase family 3 C-terminal domain-containing protein [Acidimicrobiales bacterium]